jgi:hypothetical protein
MILDIKKYILLRNRMVSNLDQYVDNRIVVGPGVHMLGWLAAAMLTDRPWDLSYQQPLYKDEWWGLV